jgi:hypothetical protein
MKTVFTVLVYLISLINLLGAGLELKSGVIYLSNGEVYFCDLNHQNTIQLTHTTNHVSDFEISPDGRFLAYSKIFKYVDEPGIFDSIPPQRAVCSIRLIDLKSDKIIKEIFPKEYEWICIDHWLNPKELLCYSEDGFSVNDSYRINIAGRIDTLEYGGFEGSKYLNSFNSKDLRMGFIKDSLANIHFVDFKNKKNITLSQKSNNSQMEVISADYGSFLWSEFFKKIIKRNDLWQLEESYHLNLYNLVNGEDKCIINKDSSPPKPFEKIEFSPDNRIVSCDRYLSDSISVYFLYSDKHIDVWGKKSHWIDSNRFLYSLDKKVYVYELDRNLSTQFLEDVIKATYVK